MAELDNLREWLRQRSGKELADLLTKVAAECGERGWTQAAGDLLEWAARLGDPGPRGPR